MQKKFENLREKHLDEHILLCYDIHQACVQHLQFNSTTQWFKSVKGWYSWAFHECHVILLLRGLVTENKCIHTNKQHRCDIE